MGRRNNDGPLNQVKFVSDEILDDDDESEGSFHPGFARRTVDEIRDLQKLVCFETNSLRCWRLIVVFLLLATGASISAFTYLFLREEEDESFAKTYDLFAERTKSVSEDYISNLVISIQELSDSITGAGSGSPTEFPFVTVPFFEVRAYHARLISGVEMFTYSPVVSGKDVELWNNYSVANQGWVADGRDYLRSLPEPDDGAFLLGCGDEQDTDITPFIWRQDALRNVVKADPPPHTPYWQSSPPPASARSVNYNMLTERLFGSLFQTTLIVREGIMSQVVDLSRYSGTFINENEHQEFHQKAFGISYNKTGWDHPHSVVVQPVFQILNDNMSPIVGVLHCSLPWDHLIRLLATDGSEGIYVILSNSCGQTYSYRLGREKTDFLGEGDYHDVFWDSKLVEVPLFSYLNNNTIVEDGHCLYTLAIYPSNAMRDGWKSDVPVYFAMAIGGTFFIITLTFFIYDGFVRRRNKIMVQTAARNNKIVASMFPSNVRDRLMAEEGGVDRCEQGTQTRLKNFLANDYAPDEFDMETDELMFKTKPIADLFPETTILFADIAGFTAWSSAREPSQVFTLLETVYRSFDVSAQRRRIFKVETVGDCYVAASGIPEPRRDHAVAMARFAKECMSKMQALTRRLEVSLGPDTADLAMRMGMHSGPVTAGVLRGERSRFQLFGDTMNTASRMESNGMRDKIQISQETADLLYAAGKADWIVPREDLVHAKGKGELKTYWLEIAQHDGASVTSGESSEGGDDESVAEMELQAQNPIDDEPKEVVFSDKALRLIDWNVDLLLRMIQLVVARRLVHPPTGPAPDEMSLTRTDTTVLDEVQEIVVLPEFDYYAEMPDPKTVILDPQVELQLYEYVTAVASMYRKNPFHNFEHASHVTMSVAKLLSRIVAPSHMDFQDSIVRDQTLHDHTYGITSDPLTQFACVFSALIHDVDHTGVPNTQLVKENHKIAEYYRGRSVAEQNSVDVSWDMLMQDEFSALRAAIYTTHDELKRFRQLVVNCVMATDIMDKDMKELRNARWERAFSEQADLDEKATINRKATIVIEHLLQASDVAHTMQHWHIYRKWNAKLFEEMYKAFKEGRSDRDPSEFWYKGEIGFFDFYIIPLAKKLKECGVFGVSSKEYLNYAEKNRQEWEARGQEALSELIENAKSVYEAPPYPPVPPPESALPSSGMKLPQNITFKTPQEKL